MHAAADIIIFLKFIVIITLSIKSVKKCLKKYFKLHCKTEKFVCITV